MRMFVLDKEVITCELCDRANCRSNVVLGRGYADNGLMIIIDQPSEMEEYYAMPIIQDQAKLLDNILNSVGLNQLETYITFMVKCRSKDSKLAKSYIKSCYPWLYQEIKQVNPKVILTMGNDTTRFLTGTKDPISSCHGKLFETYLYNPDTVTSRKKLKDEDKYDLSKLYNIVPTYSLESMLRSYTMEVGSIKYQVWQDMIKASTLLR